MNTSIKPVRISMLAACVIGLASCSAENTGLPVDPAPTSEPGRASLGYLRHRDRWYHVRDVVDPAFRAASDDPFLKRFDSDRAIADSWAGAHRDLDDRELLSAR